MSRPLVSVLTPSFNHALWLSSNLASVDAQTYPNVEHIVMDGGSSDGTVGVLQASTSSRLRWQSGSDGGQSEALNSALRIAKGEIIAWLNSDDTFADIRTLEWVVEAFERDPSADIVYGHALDTDAGGLAVRLTYSPPPWTARLDRDLNPVKQPAAFFRRRAIDAGFVRNDLAYTMDHELFLRLIRRGHRLRRIDRILATNRHQLLRKSYLRPRESYRREFLEIRRSQSTFDAAKGRLTSLIVSSVCRVIGVIAFVRADKVMRSTPGLRLPSRFDRFRYQLMTRTEPLLRRLARRDAGALEGPSAGRAEGDL